VSYHVFVDRPRDSAPGAREQLARAIAERYGLPAEVLIHHMSGGRFRVKKGVDLTTAQEFAADLARLGAVCSIEDDAGRRITTGPAASPAASRPGTDGTSGLAAALAGDVQQDLGALGTGVEGLALATIDGQADDARGAPPPAMAFAAPGGAGTGPSGPAQQPARDAFAPPDEIADDAALQLAVEPVRSPAPPMAAATPPMAAATPPMAAATPPMAAAAPSAQPAPAGSAPPSATRAPAAAASPAAGPIVRARAFVARNERARFAIGVAIALLLGFVPAHIIASVREDSAYAEIDADVRQQQAQVTDVDEWTALETIRDGKLALKQSRQRTIAAGSVFVWAVLGVGIAFVWFRKIDWARYASPGPAAYSASS
jgi:hypothetical protein